MRYLVRSIKYFLYLLVLLTIIILALVTFKVVDADLSTMFVHGYDSLWQIALVMVAFAALYPRFGYITRNVMMPGSFEDIYPVLKDVMEDFGYKEESRNGENITFRKRSTVARVLKIWEDRISFERIVSGFEMEGINKDLVRLKSAIEDKYAG